jgi:hypothetical protein
MEAPPQAPKSSLNFTVIIVVAMVLLAGLAAVFLLGGRSSNPGTTAFSKPPLPLVLTWRETLGFGKTQVAVIQGKNDVPMQLIIEVTRAVDGKTMRLQGTLEVKGILEVGKVQCPDGNNFVPGDQIVIRNNGYSPYQESCPR